MSPPSACASTRKASHIGADMNHLWPVISYSPWPIARAFVVLARTSLPPRFSVIPMPSVAPAFSQNGLKDGSYWRERMSGRSCASAAGAAASAATPACVMVTGQRWPASTPLAR